VKILGWEWDCGCPDRVAESGTNNPFIYWLVFWPVHHGPVRIIRRMVKRLTSKEEPTT
jgi:hypothetical protein